MSGHTPGPWEAVKFTIPGHEFWKAICKDGRIPEKGPQAEANARLIAAAPDLLEVITLRRKYEAMPQDRGGPTGPKGTARKAWLDAEAAAFAKATGAAQ